MGKIRVRGGTPVGSESLCRTCSWAHIVMGYRESEMLVICTDVSPNIALPFTVRECSSYNDKNRPNWDQMEKLAIDVLPTSSGKKVGFRANVDVTENEKTEGETISAQDSLEIE